MNADIGVDFLSNFATAMTTYLARAQIWKLESTANDLEQR